MTSKKLLPEGAPEAHGSQHIASRESAWSVLANVLENASSIRKSLRVLTGALCILGLVLSTGCSQGTKGELLDIGRCLQAGKVFEDSAMVKGASIRVDKMEADGRLGGGSKAMLAMAVHEEVMNELDERDPVGSLRTMKKWAQSDVCQGIKELVTSPPPAPMVTVPDVQGKCLSDIDKAIKAAGLIPHPIHVDGPDEPGAAGIGCAYSQMPAAGTQVPKGTELSYRAWFEAS